MINEQKAGMFRVLSELQKIQRAFLFDTPLSISVFYQEKGMYINAGIPDPNKENPKVAFGQACWYTASVLPSWVAAKVR